MTAPASVGLPITVEAHGYLLPAPVDLTPYLVEARWSEDTTQMGGRASLSLKIPFGQIFDVLPEDPGWWLVIRDGQSLTRRALWWGWVTAFSSGKAVGVGGTPDGISTKMTTVEAATFTAFLSAAQRILAPAVTVPQVPGAVYDFKSWGPFVKGLLSAFKFEKPGGFLESLWEPLVLQLLPPSLGGGPIGASVYVGWNFQNVAPSRSLIHIDVPGVAINALGNTLPRGSVWSTFADTFSADSTIVEMFPSLDEADIPTPLGVALGGAQPYLNYRIRPLLTQPLLDPRAVAVGLDVAVPSAASAVPVSGAYDFSATWSESDRVNGFFAQSAIRPASQMASYGTLGNPVFELESVANDGLRMFDLDWPFYPNNKVDAAVVKLPLQVDGLIALTQAIIGDGQRFARGSFMMRHDPEVKAGTWVLLNINEEPRFWRCYASAVSHSVSKDNNNTVRRRTAVNFERGHLFP